MESGLYNQKGFHHRPLPAQIEFRPAQLDDREAIAKLLSASFHRHLGTDSWLYWLLYLSIQSDLKQRLQRRKSGYDCWIAIADGAIAGVIELELKQDWPWQTAYPYCSNLAVAEAWRRQGLASQLLRQAEQTAQSWGSSQVYLHVLESNYRARSLYTKQSYSLQKRDRTWQAWMTGGSWRLFLSKPL